MLEISLASVVVFLITGLSLYTVNRVQNSGSDRSESAQQAPKDEKAELEVKEEEKQQTVTVPQEQKPAATETKPTTDKKTTTTTKEKQPTYTSIKLNLADAQIASDPVQFNASWEGSYSGVCYLTVKNLTTYKYVSKEVSINGNNCNFSLAKSELGTGSFKYYVTFKNSDKTVKGQSDYKTFNL